MSGQIVQNITFFFIQSLLLFLLPIYCHCLTVCSDRIYWALVISPVFFHQMYRKCPYSNIFCILLMFQQDVLVFSLSRCIHEFLRLASCLWWGFLWVWFELWMRLVRFINWIYHDTAVLIRPKSGQKWMNLQLETCIWRNCISGV